MCSVFCAWHEQAFTALLLVTAVARLAVTIAEDSGSTAVASDPIVLYVNLSYIATWVKMSRYEAFAPFSPRPTESQGRGLAVLNHL